MANNIVKYVLDLETKQAQKNLKKLSGEAQTFGPKAKKSTSEANAGFKTLAKSLVSVKSAMTGFVGVLRSAINFSFNFTKEAVDAINRLNDLSTASNLSAATIQAVSLAFEASGQSSRQADTFIKKFPQRLADIRKEGTDSNLILKKMGIEIGNAADGYRSSDKVFKDIIATLQNMEDAELRTAAAQRIFKRDVGNLLVALGNTGPIENFIEFTKKFGVDTETSAKNAAEFQQKIAALSLVFAFARDRIINTTQGYEFFNKALSSTIGTVVFVAEMIRLFTKEIRLMGFVIKELIVNRLGFFVEGLKIIGKIAPKVADDFGNLIQSITKVPSGTGIFQNTTVRIEQAKKMAIEAQSAILGFNRGIEDTGKKGNTANRALGELKELFEKLDNTKTENVETDKKSTKQIDKLNKAREREQKKLTDLINNYNDQIVTLKQAEKAVIKLNRSFDALKMPKDELDAFSQKLKLIADQNFIKKIDDDIKQAFADIDQIQIDIKAGTSSMRNSLMNEAFKFGNALAGAIAGQAEGMAVLAEKFTSSLGLGEGLGSNIVGSMGMISGLGQGFMQAGERAVQEKEEELGRPLTAKEQKAIMKQASLEDARLRVENFVEGFAYFIELLPEILINVLPGAIARGIVGLLRAIFNLPQNITNSIARWWASQKDNWTEGLGNFFQGVGDTFVEGVTLGFADTETFDGTYRSGGKIKSGRSGLKFTGPQKQGMALLHENEFVVPASGQKPQTVARQMHQGNGITINVSGMIVESNAVDQIVREIERRYSTFGTSTSALFGG